MLHFEVKSYVFSFFTVEKDTRVGPMSAHSGILWVIISADVHFCGFFQGAWLITVVVGFIGEEYLGIGFLVEIPATDVGIPAAAV